MFGLIEFTGLVGIAIALPSLGGVYVGCLIVGGGLLVISTFFGAGTTGTLTNNRFTDNTTGVFVGFDEFDSLAKDPNVYPMVTGATPQCHTTPVSPPRSRSTSHS